MFKLTHAVQACALLGVFLLVSCGGPQTTKDMYKGERTGPTIVPKKQPTPVSKKRMVALKKHGLDKQAKPSQLIGMQGLDVEQTLGKPSFVRRDKGVEIWQYKSENCILDLFLYKDTGGLLVDHTELRGPLLDSAGELSCFKTIVMGQTS